MKFTIINGALPDRVIIGLWINNLMQSMVLSYTELKDIMSEEDVKTIMDSPIGIWKANMEVKLM